MTENRTTPFRVLSLDGGGGKGVYTLAILLEVEKLLGKPLNKTFELFYGTSTGSIIAAALAFGASVEDILDFYLNHLPKIMKTFLSSRRSDALRSALVAFFGKKGFAELPVGLGIVATNQDEKRAMIFKSLPSQAQGMKHSFEPGFNVSIAEAVEASCSAYPFFKPKLIQPTNGAPVNVVDGGFVANNPSLYALIDTRHALNIPDERVRLLTVGTGTFPEFFPFYAYPQGITLLPTLKLISMQFAASANSVEAVFRLLSRGVASVRINDTFAEPELATSLFEHRRNVLDRLRSKGRISFERSEQEVRRVFV